MVLKLFKKGTVFSAGICILLVLMNVGCGKGDAGYQGYTASILGKNKLVALKHIPGQLYLKKLVTVEASGEKIRTKELDNAYAFAASPDGQSIAYVTDDGIYTIKVNGDQKKKLTDDSPKFDLNNNNKKLIGKLMAWSPDGTMLAFVSGGDLYVADTIKPGEEQLVTKRSSDQVFIKDGAPALAPRIEGIICPNWLDNETLIYQDFYSRYEGHYDYFYTIKSIRLDGSDRKVILEGGIEPVLSPDLNNIVYYQEDNRGGKVLVTDLGGTQTSVISKLLDSDRQPMTYSWSADGKYVLFDGFAVELESGKHFIYGGALSADSKGLKRGKSTRPPSISPDKNWIVFSAPGGPKFLKADEGGFVYDSSPAFEPLKDLEHISWIKG